VELREVGIEFTQTNDGIPVARASWGHGTGVASGLQLARTFNAFEEQGDLILGDLKFGVIRIRTDQRIMRDRNSLLLESSPGVLEATSDSGIVYLSGEGKSQTHSKDWHDELSRRARFR